MLQWIRMAWRNLGRHRGRTILSLAVVTIGVLVVILFKGMIDGMLDTMYSYNINLNSGHVRVIRPEYTVKERLLSLSYPVGETGKSYSQLIKDIRRLPGVKNAMGRIRFGMMLVNGENQETALGIGAEIDREEQVSHLSRYLKGNGAGRLPRAGSQEILLGMDLMRKLHLGVGSKVNAVFSTSFGSFNVATFRVVGKLASGLQLLDNGAAYIPLDQAMRLLEMDNVVTEIVAYGSTSAQTSRLTREIGTYLRNGNEKLQVIPWDQYNDLIMTMQKAKAAYNFVYTLILLLASFVIFNTLMMVVAERTREIGMLTALGMTPVEIRRLFLCEGLLIALIGSFTGTVLGGAANWLMSRTGIDLSSAMGMIPKELTFMPRLYPSYSPAVLVFSFLLGVAVTVLAAYLPARRAALLEPTQALRTI
ncbi:MAG TPA: FtsX-like permease family protein [Bacillota bacterium]